MYSQYPREIDPQPAYIELSVNGVVEAGYSGEIGNSVPSDVWHRRTLRWSVTPCISGEAITELLQRDDVIDLLERVHDGHDTKWNGSNFVGTLTDDAEEARDELTQIFESVDPDVGVWNVESWLFNSCTLFDHWPAGDNTLEEAVDELEANIEPKWIIHGDIREALLEDAQWRCRQTREGLGENHLSALLAHGYADEEEVAEYREECMVKPVASPTF